MVCGQIHAPATLPNYVHMHLMNKALRRQPAILETRYVYFAMLCNKEAFHYLLTICKWCRRGIWHAVSQPKQTESLCDWMSPEIWLRVL